MASLSPSPASPAKKALSFPSHVLANQRKFVTIHPWNDNKCALDVHFSSKEAKSGTVISWTTHGRDNQQWYIEVVGDGSYYIQSRVSDLFLNVYQDGIMGQCQRHHTQRWHMIPHEVHADYYYLQSTYSDQYLYNTAPKGSPLKQGLKDTNQCWRFELVTPPQAVDASTTVPIVVAATAPCTPTKAKA